MEENETLDPMPIRILRAMAEMLEPHHLRQLLPELELGIWQETSLRRRLPMRSCIF